MSLDTQYRTSFEFRPTDDGGSVWGLISDVHGNLEMLERALVETRRAGATRLAFLGDYLGRGDSDGVVRRIRDVADVALVGNRDLDWQTRVAPASRAWVLGLPRVACRGELLLAHGDARLTRNLSTAQIGRDFIGAWDELAHHGAMVFAFGHSHHARIWRKARREAPAERIEHLAVLQRPNHGPAPERAPTPAAAEFVPMATGWRYFVNVGTTGLPFPGKGGPSVMLVDLVGRGIRQLPLVTSPAE